MKVVILGKGEGWDAPFEGEVWGVNDVIFRRKVDLAFQMHDLSQWSEHDFLTKQVLYIIKHKIPVITLFKYPFIPTSKAFPLERANKRFPEYYTNSIDYMLCYAILKGVTEIDLFGVTMMYKDQRASVEFWIGIAIGQGIKVNLNRRHTDPRNLPLYSSKRYGYDK